MNEKILDIFEFEYQRIKNIKYDDINAMNDDKNIDELLIELIINCGSLLQIGKKNHKEINN